MAGRATSIADLMPMLMRLISEEGFAYAAAFAPRPTDVLIATYAKAGTTWMQQIFHGLRTGGDMNFSEITEVVPWIELAHDLGHDLAADQAGGPRAFKTHMNGHEVPPGCRYMYIVRDPRDVALSFYNFMDGWLFEPGCITLDEFIAEFIVEHHMSGHYWAHLLSWWPRRNDADTLFLTYEEMKADLPRTVRRVADFAAIEASAETLEIATRQATFDFMKSHDRQFDDHLVTAARNSAFGVSQEFTSSKLGTGKIGGHKQAMSEASIEILDRMWQGTIGAELGIDSYDDLRAALVG